MIVRLTVPGWILSLAIGVVVGGRGKTGHLCELEGKREREMSQGCRDVTSSYERGVESHGRQHSAVTQGKIEDAGRSNSSK